jgi:gliding motility-associated lipoprotein GldH
MKFYPKSLIVFFLILSANACNNEDITFTKFTDISGETWTWDDPCSFEFEITDDNITYNRYIDLRLTDNYPKSNIHIQSQTITPAGDTINTLFPLLLFNVEGVTLGKKSGKLMNYSKPIAHNERLEKGKYTVKLIQHTRVFELNGVNAVGYSIHRGDPVF